MRAKHLLSAAAVIIALAGCSYRVNLTAQRTAYDSYLDLAPRLKAQATSKRSLYKEILSHTRERDNSPYPEMAAELDVMDRNGIEATNHLEKVRAFERRYDEFAQGRDSISSDDKEAWPRFQGLQNEFQAIVRPIDSSRQAFDQASSRFDALMSQYHVAKVNVADLRADAAAFNSELSEGTQDMRERYENDRKGLVYAAVSGTTVGVLKQKYDLLGQMEKLLPKLLSNQQAMDAALKNINKSLPTSGVVWTGPGMNGDLSAMDAYDQCRSRYQSDRGAFEALAKRFDKAADPTPVPAAAPAKAPGY